MGKSIARRARLNIMQQNPLSIALTHSDWLRRTLAADPALEARLIAELERPFTRADMAVMLAAYPLDSEDAVKHALRKLRQAVLARLIARDLSSRATLDEVMATISGLAIFSVDAALRALKPLLARYGARTLASDGLSSTFAVGLDSLSPSYRSAALQLAGQLHPIAQQAGLRAQGIEVFAKHLDGDLCPGLEVLHRAAATGAEMRTARRHPLRRRFDDALAARDFVARLLAKGNVVDEFAGQRAFDDLLQIVEADDPPVTFDKNGLIEAAATAKVIVDRSEVHAGFRSDGFAGGFSVPGGREQRSCGFHDAGTGQLAIGTGAAARFGHS